MTFEQSLDRLDEIIALLSNEKVTLEQSLELYSEGAALIEKASKELSEAKLKIEKLNLNKEVTDDEL